MLSCLNISELQNWLVELNIYGKGSDSCTIKVTFSFYHYETHSQQNLANFWRRCFGKGRWVKILLSARTQQKFSSVCSSWPSHWLLRDHSPGEWYFLCVSRMRPMGYTIKRFPGYKFKRQKQCSPALKQLRLKTYFSKSPKLHAHTRLRDNLHLERSTMNCPLSIL